MNRVKALEKRDNARQASASNDIELAAAKEAVGVSEPTFGGANEVEASKEKKQ